jgi:hypothetical protein
MFLSILISIIFGCSVNDGLENDLNNNTQDTPVREKWNFFNIDNLYIDEMNFNTSIPEIFWGDWGQPSHLGYGTAIYEFGGYIEDILTNRLLRRVIECGFGENNIQITLTINKLTFHYYYGIVDCASYYGNYSFLPGANYLYYGNHYIHGKKSLDFNLIAENADVFYFISEDKKYGFTFQKLPVEYYNDADFTTNMSYPYYTFTQNNTFNSSNLFDKID